VLANVAASLVEVPFKIRNQVRCSCGRGRVIPDRPGLRHFFFAAFGTLTRRALIF
jgi:hypothetical protein